MRRAKTTSANAGAASAPRRREPLAATARRVRALLARADEGSVTIEAAIASTALIVLLAGMLAGFVAVGAKLSAIDQAGAAARAKAIGTAFAPSRGEVVYREEGPLIVAEVTVPSPLGSMRAEAAFPKEVLP